MRISLKEEVAGALEQSEDCLLEEELGSGQRDKGDNGGQGPHPDQTA